MNKTLEGVIKHLNPLHDYDGFRFYSMSGSDLDETNIKTFLVELSKRGVRNLYPLIYIPKNIIRGGLAGGAAGTLVSLVLGDSPREGFAVGSTLGAFADMMQFYLRYPYYYGKQMQQKIGIRESLPNIPT